MSKGDRIIEIYTDGGCWPNPGNGGWAYVILENKTELWHSCGGSKNATSNMMEITAATKALQSLKEWPYFDSNIDIIIYSDSQYLINGITKWIKNWKAAGWKTKKGNNPIKNKDLWEALFHVVSPNISWKWVRGHSGNVFNEMADQLSHIGKNEA